MAFGLLYIIFIATSTSWLNQLGAHFPISVLLFYSALISIITFNLFSLKNIKSNHKNIYTSPKNWSIMSVSVLFIWCLSYYSSIKSSAGFHLCIFFLSTALLSSLAEFKKINSAVCVLSIGLIYTVSPCSTFTVLLSSMASGLAGYIYYRTSYKFSKETKASVLAVLSVRFYLFFIGTTIYLFSSGEIAHLKVSIENCGLLILLGLTNMVIPVFLSQKSLQTVGVSQFTFLTTLIPTLTFFLDVIFGQVWQSGMLIACLWTTIILNLDNLKKNISSIGIPVLSSIFLRK